MRTFDVGVLCLCLAGPAASPPPTLPPPQHTHTRSTLSTPPPRLPAPQVTSALDRLVEALQGTLQAKVKADAVKQEVDRNEDMLRSCLRAVDALAKLPNTAQVAPFKAFMDGVVLAPPIKVGRVVCVCVCVCVWWGLLTAVALCACVLFLCALDESRMPTGVVPPPPPPPCVSPCAGQVPGDQRGAAGAGGGGCDGRRVRGGWPGRPPPSCNR